MLRNEVLYMDILFHNQHTWRILREQMTNGSSEEFHTLRRKFAWISVSRPDVDALAYSEVQVKNEMLDKEHITEIN